MRRIIGTIGATLVVVAAIATSATPASACQGPGWYNCDPPKPSPHFGMGDGSVRFVSY